MASALGSHIRLLLHYLESCITRRPGIYDISHLSYHVIPPVRPHELRRTSPGRLVALRRLVGPHLQGRLSTKALTRVRSCLRRCDLPPCAGGEAAELSGDPRQKTPSRVFPVTVVLCTTGDGRYSHQALQCQRAVVRSCENRRPVLFFENTAKGLTPKILWLGRSDSRVPEGVYTASPQGYIFVHRNIAKQVAPLSLSIRPNVQYSQTHPDDDSALAVLMYAVGTFPSIEHVLVVGHTKCGGARAALEATTESPPPQVGPVLQRLLTPLVELAQRLVGGSPHPEILTRLIEVSGSVQVNNVANSEPVPKAWAGGRKNL